jgi:hypothetical protein
MNMENNLGASYYASNLTEKLKSKLDPHLSNILKKYSFDTEVKWRYEGFKNIQYQYDSFGISVIFLKKINEDDYGFDISFKISGMPSPIMSAYIARGDGKMILSEREFILDELNGLEEKIDDLVDEYTLISGLLVKEYILECNPI